MGHSRPGDMGFDIVHVNLHKSFSQPHGGGGPGSGPIAVSDRIAPFLPAPRIVAAPAARQRRRAALRPRPRRRRSRSAACAASRATSASSSAPTPTSLSLGGDGLARGLGDGRAQRQLPAGAAARGARREVPADRLRPRADARVRALGPPAKRELEVRTLDIAKRLLDYGFHPPTIYFPLLVDEALMIEPTETETRESLDGFAEAIESILAEAERRPRDRSATPPTRPRCAVSTRRRPVASRSSGRLSPKPGRGAGASGR